MNTRIVDVPANLDEFDAFAALPETVEAVIASEEYARWRAECDAQAEADAETAAQRFADEDRLPEITSLHADEPW